MKAVKQFLFPGFKTQCNLSFSAILMHRKAIKSHFFYVWFYCFSFCDFLKIVLKGDNEVQTYDSKVISSSNNNNEFYLLVPSKDTLQ